MYDAGVLVVRVVLGLGEKVPAPSLGDSKKEI